MIVSLMAPTSWDEIGGPGSIAWLSMGRIEALVVSQTPDVHEEIEAFLKRPEFRRSQTPRTGASRAEPPLTEASQAERPSPSPRRRGFPLRRLLRRR